LKVDILVLLLGSYDIDFVKVRKLVPNVYRIGTPYPIKVQQHLPAISHKASYCFYTGNFVNFRNDKEFFHALTKKQNYFWNELKECRVGLLGFFMIEDMFPSDCKHLVCTPETPFSLEPVVRPLSIKERFKDKLDKIKTLKGLEFWMPIYYSSNTPVEDAKKVTMGYHEINMELIKSDYPLDILVVADMAMDRFSHILSSPDLAKIFTWHDKLTGNILDNVETKNIIAFAEHGAHHSPEGLFVSKTEYKHKKIEHYSEITPLIKELWEKIRCKK